MIYAVLSSFSGSLIATSNSTPNTNSLAKFNMASGDWRIYLVMSVLMEAIVTVIYTVAGATIPLKQDYQLGVGGQAPTGYLPPMEQDQYSREQYAYAPSVPYASQTAYDPESQALYHSQEHFPYAPPPVEANVPK
jgi:hypothetical protein